MAADAHSVRVDSADSRQAELATIVEAIDRALADAHRAREAGLAACRRVIRASGSAIRAVHRREDIAAEEFTAEAEEALRAAQHALVPYPSLQHAGFLHDAEKEYAEARLTATLVAGGVLPEPAVLGVDVTAWLRGLAEAASELRRHLLDRLRAGDLAAGERLLRAMDDVYDALMRVDYPDAITNGLRRSVDSLRAVLERTRGDVTATAVQSTLTDAIEAATRRLGRAPEFG